MKNKIITLTLFFFLNLLISEKHQGLDNKIPDKLKKILENNSSKISATKQIIMVTNDNPNSIQVKIELFEKNNNWIKKDILINGVLGLKGFAPINKKREGDYKTPVGIYSLGLAFGYEKNVITKLEYRQLTDDDYWVDDPNAPNYNQWVIGKPNVKSFEKMKRNDNLYKYGIVVNYNMNPVIKWKGSAVFFHLWRGPNLGTGGCIGLSEKDILIILKWLDREKKPLVILGTNSDLDKLIF